MSASLDDHQDLSRICCFRVDNILCGVDIAVIREITALSETTKVYLSPPLISGIVNIRGQIVTIINLRRCFEVPDRQETERAPQAILVDYNDHTVGLLVDQVDDILEVDPDKLEPPPAHLAGIHGKFVEGVYKKDTAIVSILNIKEILATAHTNEAETAVS